MALSDIRAIEQRRADVRDAGLAHQRIARLVECAQTKLMRLEIWDIEDQILAFHRQLVMIIGDEVTPPSALSPNDSCYPQVVAITESAAYVNAWAAYREVQSKVAVLRVAIHMAVDWLTGNGGFDFNTVKANLISALVLTEGLTGPWDYDAIMRHFSKAL